MASSFVLALAFISNNGFVYVSSVFIIASLITELEFLEKIAAIMFKNESYFKYPKLKPPASNQEVKEELKKQALENKVPKDHLDIYIEKVINFEETVFDLLLDYDNGIFSPNGFIKHPKILLPNGRKQIFDAMVDAGKYIYLVEIKEKFPSRIMLDAKYYADIIEKSFVDSVRRQVTARVLIVTKESSYSQDLIEENLAILKVKNDLSGFLNRGKILEWVNQS
jgi:hypothetical protein